MDKGCGGLILILAMVIAMPFCSAAPSSLTIWDDVDPDMPFGGAIKVETDVIDFYAAYLDEDDQPIQGADCRIRGELGSAQMVYEDYGGRGLYHYDVRVDDADTYDWSVTCQKSGYDSKTANDDIEIISRKHELCKIDQNEDGIINIQDLILLLKGFS